MMNKKTLFWFRQDLRLSDNPGLYEAVLNGSVLAIYILDEEKNKDVEMGAASMWWLHHSLTKLARSLDNKLNFYKGDAKEVILKLIKEYAIDQAYWSRCYEPARLKQDAEIKDLLTHAGIDCQDFNASLLWEPELVLKSDKTPYKVFTPFYRNGCLSAQAPRIPLEKPKKLNLIKDLVHAIDLENLGLLKQKLPTFLTDQDWIIGEDGALSVLATFIQKPLENYKEGRNVPAKKNVSRLSPYLHFGEISPNQAWYAAKSRAFVSASLANNVDCFLSELGWREFSYSLLYHFPDLPRKNFQSKFDSFPWRNNQQLLAAWQQGQTGYPIVDAGMRELLQTGYMHNRVRMIVGSFLAKNLLLHWHHGADWFWDRLVDADLANNSASWQWIAGSGADAAPYFRIFNPVTQGEKFDPDGVYTKRFLPELAALPSKYLFNPWEAKESILRQAGVTLGKTYPWPIVDLKVSRDNALESFKSLSTEIK
jgi:deoxyribodipyrimidine photo-lyase